MGEQEHLELARRLAELSDRLYQDGDDVAAAEMLWGAVNRIINAIALQHRLSDGRTPPRRGVVLHHLASRHTDDYQTDDIVQRGRFAAGALHGHFYNSHLAPAELPQHFANTQSFITDLLNLYHQHNRQ